MTHKAPNPKQTSPNTRDIESQKATTALDDAALDTLFQSQPKAPCKDFTERVMRRLEDSAPMDGEAQLDALLSSHPVCPKADFTERTLARLNNTTQEDATRNLLHFPHLLRVAAAAAAIAVGFWLGYQQLSAPQDFANEQQIAETLPSTPQQPTADAQPTPMPEALANPYAEYETLLALNEPFRELSGLTDAETLEALNLFIN